MTMARGMLAALLLVGCGNKDKDKDGTAEPGVEPACGNGACVDDENYLNCADDCSLSPLFDGDLSGCADDVPQSEIDEELQLFLEIDQDVHEMVTCGALVVRLLEAMVAIGTDFAESATEPSTPDGYDWNAGTFLASPDATTAMELQLLWGDGFDTASRGTLIAEDLFSMDSYLVDPELDFDLTTFEILIRHDGLGPLVELLGYGTSPGRPIRIDEGNVSLGRWSDLLLSGQVVLDTERAPTSVSYVVGFDEQNVGNILSPTGLASSVQTLTASDASGSAVAGGWDVEYKKNANGLLGTIDTSKTGGRFDVDGTLVYDRTPFADVIEVSCPTQ